jgi:uncharacterized membrane protein YraQ (UPF0718 family)
MERRDGMPALVYWGLYGIKTRNSAVAFMWICFALGAVAIFSTYTSLRPPLGIALILAGLIYRNAIRWVDKNAHWD